MTTPARPTFVFIGGLHRSGTTLLARCLADHPEASGLTDTGVSEDEGQHLQSVYPPASQHGGPGRFGFSSAMHMTESSPLATGANRQELLSSWSPHWDRECPVLIEKSPPNMLKTRFLQALFPDAHFIMVLRHPVATTFATRQMWGYKQISSLIRHWLVCNETMLGDLSHLQHITLLRYEDLIAAGDSELMRLHRFIGIPPEPYGLEPQSGLNEKYFLQWDKLKVSPWRRPYRELVIRRFEERINRFGYSLTQPTPLITRDEMLDRLLGAGTHTVDLASSPQSA